MQTIIIRNYIRPPTPTLTPFCHTHTHTKTTSKTCMLMQRNRHAYTHAGTHTCRYTNTHTHTYTCAHTHTHIHASRTAAKVDIRSTVFLWNLEKYSKSNAHIRHYINCSFGIHRTVYEQLCISVHLNETESLVATVNVATYGCFCIA